MNTDNMSILGLTLDYGVYGFMPAYDPAYSPNANDEQGRYAFDQQVEVGRWNRTNVSLLRCCVTIARSMRIRGWR